MNCPNPEEAYGIPRLPAYFIRYFALSGTLLPGTCTTFDPLLDANQLVIFILSLDCNFRTENSAWVGRTRNPRSNVMNIDRMVIRFAGFVVLISLLLSQLHSAYWLWLTAFVGLNLFQSSFTGFCPLAMVLKKLGGKSKPAFE